MATIKAFRGILYNHEKIRDRAKVVAPPYDVISPTMQDRLYRAHPNNIIRLILGKKKKSDNERENQYTRSRDYFSDWLSNEMLVRDRQEALYLYGHDYREDGAAKSRVGFIGLLKLEKFSKKGVLPHEHVFSIPKADRLRLIQEVRANLSPIFSLFEDDNGRITKVLLAGIRAHRPVLDVSIDGVRHRLWKLTDEKTIAVLKKAFRSKRIFIADGHHRYSVALAYRDLMKRSGEHLAAHDYVMMYLTAMNEHSLTILPSHRMVHDIKGLTRSDILGHLKDHFDAQEVSGKQRLLAGLKKGSRGDKHVFGLFMDKRFYLIRMKNTRSLDGIDVPGTSRQWKRLDVSILHYLILRKLLGLDDSEGNVSYTRDADEATREVSRGTYALAIFLNPTRIQSVEAIARNGELMPHKATYFYPKLLSGLVLNVFA